ncbi:hypothetical protein [Bacillus pseudomycoides]|uniref:hypothetical protein n=1 Tax=Bacillus pseudomycoides TaxID=64104 RepID=UPI0015D4830A|nr:hypothetical protein [Bacillus pseudomycoides]
MRLEIEKFIGEVSFPKAALSFIDEGILCYKVGAYRSAYIMSYLFLLNVVKYRVLESSSIPNGITEGEWNAKKTQISNEDTWENKVFDLICAMDNSNSHSRYFKISKTRVAQMEYWRSLRNDCAHSKDNLIAAAHVESLWLFTQSILLKLVINGSKEFLMTELEDYFENVYFNDHNKAQQIVKSIPHLAENNNIVELLIEIHNVFKAKRNYSLNKPNGKGLEFWRAINDSGQIYLSDKFNEFLTSSNEIFSIFIAFFPERFTQCLNKRPIISHFINKELPDYLFFNYPNAVELLCKCLRNELIDTTNSQKLINNINSSDLKQLTSEQIILLKTHGYFEKIKNSMMNKLHCGHSFSYSTINGNSVGLAYFIKYCLIEDEDSEKFIVLLNNTFKTLDNESVFKELNDVLIEKTEILDFIKTTLESKNEELCDFFCNL